LRGFLRQRVIRCLRCLGIGCRHWSLVQAVQKKVFCKIRCRQRTGMMTRSPRLSKEADLPCFNAED
jgi:hypothetical protein